MSVGCVIFHFIIQTPLHDWHFVLFKGSFALHCIEVSINVLFEVFFVSTSTTYHHDYTMYIFSLMDLKYLHDEFVHFVTTVTMFCVLQRT